MSKLSVVACLVMGCAIFAGCSSKTASVKPAEETFTISELKAIGEKVHFDFDSANIKEEDIAILKKKAEVLKSKRGICTVIYGNTDPVGGEKYNYQLGLRRAQTVYDFLISEGVEEHKINVKSLGKMNPVYPEDNTSKEVHALDRRDDFVIEIK